MALLPLLVFASPALVRSAFYVFDIQHYFYPYHAVAADAVAAGHLPLWNPYAFGGIPLLGDGQTALFYPANWLFFLLPGAAALNYAVLAEFSIAGVGSYLLARTLGLWRLPAFLVAVAYMFSGFLTARVVHLSIMSTAALIPLVFFCVERAFQTGSRRWHAAAAAAVAVQAVAGHPQIPIYTALALLLYALVRGAERAAGTRRRRLLVVPPLQLLGIYLLGFALAAVQLLPWAELASLSPRAAGAPFDFVFAGSLGQEVPLFFFPYLYGSPSPGPFGAEPLPRLTAIRTWEHSAYVGIPTLALAAVALLRRVPPSNRGRENGQPGPTDGAAGDADRRRWFSTLFFALLLLVGIAMAGGRNTALGELIYATPVLGRLREVERAAVLAAFALTVLSGLGLQYLIERRPRPGGRIRTPALLVLAALVVLVPVGLALRLGLVVGQPAPPQALGQDAGPLDTFRLSSPNLYVPLALSVATAVLLAWWSRRPVTARAQVFLAGLLLLDMSLYAANFNPTTDPSVYEREPAVVGFLRQEREPFRKATFLTDNWLDVPPAQDVLGVSWPMVYGMEDVNGFNSLQPRRYTDYLFSPTAADVSYGELKDRSLLEPQSSLLSALNVKYLLVPRGSAEPPPAASWTRVYSDSAVDVYRNERVYPRAWFARDVRAEPDGRRVLEAVRSPGFDGRSEALVESQGLPAIPAPSGPGDPATVSVTHRGPNRVGLVTSATTDRLLVVSEMYFPGWRARVDGAETTVYRINYLFRGIVVPAGQHQVEFDYLPASLLLGAAISALALVVTAVLVLGRGNRGAATGA